MLQLESGLGLGPWDVLNQGISEQTPLSFGAANVVVALVVLVVAWALGARIGPGTVANAVLIGVFVDLLLRLEAIEGLSDEPLGASRRPARRSDPPRRARVGPLHRRRLRRRARGTR